MTKFSAITSIDGAEPLNIAVKISENIIMYAIAIDVIITIYDSNLSQIDERLSER